jgi:hypothetical protein
MNLELPCEFYLHADQQACLAALENLHAKYAVTVADIKVRRDAAVAELRGFLGELGYATLLLPRTQLSTIAPPCVE